MNKLIINTDGGARGNPGPAASAFIIQTPEHDLLFKDGKYLGVATNNEAEYSGVILAFEKVTQDFLSKQPLEIEVRADSKLVVEQLSGRFKVKNPRIKALYEKVKLLEKNLGFVVYKYVPRAENYLADGVVNETLDKVQENS